LALYHIRDRILLNPVYQREGGVWTRSKKQLFIDSLLNRYDIPKLYFHKLSGEFLDSSHDYSLIDGRQRLEAIWDFLQNKFPLDKDFVFMEDNTTELAGKYFKEFVAINPRMTTRLYSRALSVMVVNTDDADYIEDMFTRLNEAVPLNAAEKRNSFGGPLPIVTRQIVHHLFFSEHVAISNTRYRHHDLAAKMLWLNHSTVLDGIIPDTKKVTLDTYYRSCKRQDMEVAELDRHQTEAVLSDMAHLFGDRDELLRSSGVLPVYFLLFQQLRMAGCVGWLTRQQLSDFEAARADNRFRLETAEDDAAAGVDPQLIEYDELAQSSNDAASISSRLATLRKHLGLPDFEYPAAQHAGTR
jgi:hypothetical protein